MTSFFLHFIRILRSAMRVLCIPYYTPIQLVSPSLDHKNLVIVPETIMRLNGLRKPISIITVVGPYHSGKSFLLNSLVKNLSVFTVGAYTDPQTMGIWLCRTEEIARDGSEIWLADSEGFFGPGVAVEYDAKVFTTAAIISNRILYNTVKVIDQNSVDLLEMLAKRARLFKMRSINFNDTNKSEEDIAPGIPLTASFFSEKRFPGLTWVVSDFVQKVENPQTVKNWLHKYLDVEDRPGYLKAIFGDIDVATLFLPATNRKQLEDLSTLTWEDLTVDYRSEIETLSHKLFRSAQSMQLNNEERMTTDVLATLVHFVCNALSSGYFTELPSLWQSWASQVGQVAVNDAIILFETRTKVLYNKNEWRRFKKLQNIGVDKNQELGDLPSASLFSQISVGLVTEAILFNRKIAKDFGLNWEGVSSQMLHSMSEIHKRATEKWEDVAADNIRHVYNTLLSSVLKSLPRLPSSPLSVIQVQGEIIQRLTHEYEEAIRWFAPVPTSLDAIFNSQTTSNVFGFTHSDMLVSESGDEVIDKEQIASVISNLGSRGIPSDVEMVHFRGEINRILGEYEQKNTQTILNVVSEGLSIAKAGVDSSIQGLANTLMVDKDLEDKFASIRRTAVNQFEASATESAIKSIDNRSSSRTILQNNSKDLKRIDSHENSQNTNWVLQTEAYVDNESVLIRYVDKKMNDYRATHDDRLSTFFENHIQHVFNHFKALKRDIEMRELPAEEMVLDQKRDSIFKSVINSFSDRVSLLSDTNRWVTSKDGLIVSMNVEWQKLKTKNVELWKVHSDEATSCTIQLNAQYESLNCPWGWCCLFKIFPTIHRTIVFRHMELCFENRAVSSHGSKTQKIDGKNNEKHDHYLHNNIPPSIRLLVFESWYTKEGAKDASAVHSNMISFTVSLCVPLLWILWKCIKTYTKKTVQKTETMKYSPVKRNHVNYDYRW